MILGFKDKEAEKIFHQQWSKKLPAEIQIPARMKLLMLDSAMSIEDLRNPPGNRLEALGGNRKNQWSIRINRQWRLCFTWSEAGADHVEITDYH